MNKKKTHGYACTSCMFMYTTSEPDAKEMCPCGCEMKKIPMYEFRRLLKQQQGGKK